AARQLLPARDRRHAHLRDGGPHMIARAVRRPALPWPRRALGGLGRATIFGAHRLLVFLSLTATVLVVVFRRGTWRRPVRLEFWRMLNEVTVRSLPTTAATGLLIGFALVSQAVYWLAQTGTTRVSGAVVVGLLVAGFAAIPG